MPQTQAEYAMTPAQTALIQALLAAVPKLRRDDLPYSPMPAGGNLIYKWLYPALSQDGRFMQYVEWKEPYVYLDKLAAVKAAGQNFPSPAADIEERFYQDFLSRHGLPPDTGYEDLEDMSDDDNDWEWRFREYEEGYFADFALDCYNRLLQSLGLRLVVSAFGDGDNSFLLCVRDNADAVAALEQAFAALGVKIPHIP
ncbi:MAG: hypothetical protein Q3966_06285 [Neisseria sp.]|nr:hypothetical protein [Neisseria sp.]